MRWSASKVPSSTEQGTGLTLWRQEAKSDCIVCGGKGAQARGRESWREGGGARKGGRAGEREHALLCLLPGWSMASSEFLAAEPNGTLFRVAGLGRFFL